MNVNVSVSHSMYVYMDVHTYRTTTPPTPPHKPTHTHTFPSSPTNKTSTPSKTPTGWGNWAPAGSSPRPCGPLRGSAASSCWASRRSRRWPPRARRRGRRLRRWVCNVIYTYMYWVCVFWGRVCGEEVGGMRVCCVGGWVLCVYATLHGSRPLISSIPHPPLTITPSPHDGGPVGGGGGAVLPPLRAARARPGPPGGGLPGI